MSDVFLKLVQILQVGEKCFFYWYNRLVVTTCPQGELLNLSANLSRPIGAVASGHRNLSFLFDDLSTHQKRTQKMRFTGNICKTYANHHVLQITS